MYIDVKIFAVLHTKYDIKTYTHIYITQITIRYMANKLHINDIGYILHMRYKNKRKEKKNENKNNN